jgi:hypothetical protein
MAGRWKRLPPLTLDPVLSPPCGRCGSQRMLVGDGDTRHEHWDTERVSGEWIEPNSGDYADVGYTWHSAMWLPSIKVRCLDCNNIADEIGLMRALTRFGEKPFDLMQVFRDTYAVQVPQLFEAKSSIVERIRRRA